MRKSSLIAILLGGFIAGTIDIGAAALIEQRSPLVILHFVAGGLIGKQALAGGASVEILGLILQWAMSLIIAYILASGKVAFHPSRLVRERPGLRSGHLHRDELRGRAAFRLGSMAALHRRQIRSQPRSDAAVRLIVAFFDSRRIRS